MMEGISDSVLRQPAYLPQREAVDRLAKRQSTEATVDEDASCGFTNVSDQPMQLILRYLDPHDLARLAMTGRLVADKVKTIEPLRLWQGCDSLRNHTELSRQLSEAEKDDGFGLNTLEDVALRVRPQYLKTSELAKNIDSAWRLAFHHGRIEGIVALARWSAHLSPERYSQLYNVLEFIEAPEKHTQALTSLARGYHLLRPVQKAGLVREILRIPNESQRGISIGALGNAFGAETGGLCHDDQRTMLAEITMQNEEAPERYPVAYGFFQSIRDTQFHKRFADIAKIIDDKLLLDKFVIIAVTCKKSGSAEGALQFLAHIFEKLSDQRGDRNMSPRAAFLHRLGDGAAWSPVFRSEITEILASKLQNFRALHAGESPQEKLISFAVNFSADSKEIAVLTQLQRLRVPRGLRALLSHWKDLSTDQIRRIEQVLRIIEQYVRQEAAL